MRFFNYFSRSVVLKTIVKIVTPVIKKVLGCVRTVSNAIVEPIVNAVQYFTGYSTPHLQSIAQSVVRSETLSRINDLANHGAHPIIAYSLLQTQYLHPYLAVVLGVKISVNLLAMYMSKNEDVVDKTVIKYDDESDTRLDEGTNITTPTIFPNARETILDNMTTYVKQENKFGMVNTLYRNDVMDHFYESTNKSHEFQMNILRRLKAQDEFFHDITSAEIDDLIEGKPPSDSSKVKLLKLRSAIVLREESDRKQSVVVLKIIYILQRLIGDGDEEFLMMPEYQSSVQKTIQLLDKKCKQWRSLVTDSRLQQMDMQDCLDLSSFFEFPLFNEPSIGGNIECMRERILSNCTEYTSKIPYRVVALLLKNSLVSMVLVEGFTSLLRQQALMKLEVFISKFNSILNAELYTPWGELNLQPNVIFSIEDWQCIAGLSFKDEHAMASSLIMYARNQVNSILQPSSPCESKKSLKSNTTEGSASLPQPLSPR